MLSVLGTMPDLYCILIDLNINVNFQDKILLNMSLINSVKEINKTLISQKVKNPLFHFIAVGSMCMSSV